MDNLLYQRDRQLSIRLGHDIRRDLRLLAAQFGCSSDPNNAPIRPVSHASIMAWPTDQSSRSIPLIFVPSQCCSSMTNVRARTLTEVRHPARAAYPPLHSADQRLLKEGRERLMDAHEITVHRTADYACNGVVSALGDLERYRVFRPLIDHLIDNAPLHRHFPGQEVVALEHVLDLLERLAGVLHVDLVEALLEIQDLLGMKHDVGCLALKATGRLMQHDTRVRECEPHALLAGSQQQRRHGGGLADAQSGDRRADELHRVIDRKARRHDTAWRVDVHCDLFLRIVRFQEQELGDHEGRHISSTAPVMKMMRSFSKREKMS